MNEYIIPGTIILVVLITALVVIGIWHFGHFLFSKRMIEKDTEPFQKEFFHNLMIYIDKTDKSMFAKLVGVFSNMYGDFSERRNDFWTVYGQIIICIFIVCVIALLLLTGVIKAEAGLPILSAISGFAIAKGTTVRNKGNDNIISSGKD